MNFKLLKSIFFTNKLSLMLLRDMPYKCKRHNGVLQCKKLKEGEMYYETNNINRSYSSKSGKCVS